MSFEYHRTVHFGDTDAAGVVFFANHLAICHEAYEESLAAAGIDLKTFFSRHGVVVPIVKCQAEYFRPLACGDRLRIQMRPVALARDSFAIDFELFRRGRPDKLAARVHTEHVCVATPTHRRVTLPAPLAGWLKQGAGRRRRRRRTPTRSTRAD